MQDPEDLGRQLRRLTQSRTRWKNRVAEKQGHILYLRVKVRDLLASRDYWKQRAVLAESSRLTPSREEALALPLGPVALLDETIPPALEPVSLRLSMARVPGEA